MFDPPCNICELDRCEHKGNVKPLLKITSERKVGSGFTTDRISMAARLVMFKAFDDQIDALTNSKANPVRNGFTKKTAEALKSGHRDGAHNMLRLLVDMGVVVVVHEEPEAK